MDSEFKAEMKFKILKLVMENGSENIKREPLKQAQEFYSWAIRVGRPEKK